MCGFYVCFASVEKLVSISPYLGEGHEFDIQPTGNFASTFSTFVYILFKVTENVIINLIAGYYLAQRIGNGTAYNQRLKYVSV